MASCAPGPLQPDGLAPPHQALQVALKRLQRRHVLQMIAAAATAELRQGTGWRTVLQSMPVRCQMCQKLRRCTLQGQKEIHERLRTDPERQRRALAGEVPVSSAPNCWLVCGCPWLSPKHQNQDC